MKNKISIRSFRDLEIWKLGKKIVIDVYKVTDRFPKKENYSITSQMHRAVVSIPSSIAEGFRRQHGTEFKQFLHIALGSSAELETQIEVATDLGFMRITERDYLLEKLDHLSRMIRSLINKLKK